MAVASHIACTFLTASRSNHSLGAHTCDRFCPESTSAAMDSFLVCQADPVLATEMQRYQAGQPMAKLDQERYNMRDPPQLKKNDIATWQNCIQNAHSQLEHQLNRYRLSTCYEMIYPYNS